MRSGSLTTLEKLQELFSTVRVRAVGPGLLNVSGMVVVIARGRERLYGVTPLARSVLILPLLSLALTVLTLAFALVALQRRSWSLAGRLHYLLVGLVGLAFLASLDYWNLLGSRF